VTGNAPVPRETPPAPTTAQGVFGVRLPLAAAYADALATDGVARGLIGPREAPRLWERHLLNCAVLTEMLDQGTDVCDIGSGAGLPGVVLAIRRPDLHVVLVEPLLRRTSFLEQVVHRLRLTNVEVLRHRAEELHGAREFSSVTSRAVAPLPRLLDWCMPLVRESGQMLAMKGATAADEVRDAAEALRRCGAQLPVAIHRLGEGVISPPTTVIRVQSTRPSALGLGQGARRAERPAGRRSRREGRRRDADRE
jgi:16S rRNA (guanine527-N7)-methyltransferase